MPTATRPAPATRKPRPKPSRSIRLMVRPAPDQVGVVRITVGKEAAEYLLTPVAADFGCGFLLEKIGFQCEESVYHVNVNGRLSSCECKGFLRWGKCKHIDGVAVLIERKLI